MVERRAGADPTPLFVAATTSYVINCALGGGVATGRIRTGRLRWVHHALYGTTAALTTVAISSLGWSRSRAGWLLLPAGVSLALIPYVSARSRKHPAVALSAAPFYVSSLVCAHLCRVRRGSDGLS